MNTCLCAKTVFTVTDLENCLLRSAASNGVILLVNWNNYSNIQCR